MRQILIFLSFLTLLASCRDGDFTAALPDHPDFNFDIRPILSEKCFLCHGPDATGRKIDLRLDTYEGATALLKSGRRAIDPDHWKASGMWERINSTDPEIVMPPPASKKSLSEREIALLKRWLQQGAEWKTYWAFIPPEKPEIPTNPYPEARVNEIDAFINHKLGQKGLTPNEQADSATLIRRLSYLLTGLPPTPAELELFLDDTSDDAYEKLVNRLLASPAFGERWARHWMDLARYGEGRGHEFDFPVIGAWHYRDYLIRAFNQDVPYDLFVREQLAGDQLDQPRWNPEEGFNESVIGTAFYTLGEGKHSPVDIREEEADRIENIIDVTSKTFQGLTVACAKCHDHKFDPIPTKDYYAMYGIFESMRYAVTPVRTKVSDLALLDSLHETEKEIRQFISRQLRPVAMPTRYSGKTAPAPVDSSSISWIGDFRDGTTDGWMAQGFAFDPPNALGRMEVDSATRQLAGFAEAKVSGQMGLQGALRSPTFTLQHDSLLVRAAGQYSIIRIVIDNFQLIQNPIYGGLEKSLESGEEKDYVFDLSMWKGHKAYVELQVGTYTKKQGKYHHFAVRDSSWLEARYAFAFDGAIPSHIAGDPPLAFDEDHPQPSLERWAAFNSGPKDVALLQNLLDQGYLSKDLRPVWTQLEQINRWRARLRDTTAIAGVTTGDKIYSPVFNRGNHLEPLAEQIPHHHFSAMEELAQPFPDHLDSRLALARAIVDPRNPLTARVMVNRLWHHLFGRGIVETVDNFGLQGKSPTHPLLLDHLATKFVADGWSIKNMIRYIVLSQTFRRSTDSPDEAEKNDPQNRFLSHFPVRRLEAEAIRDAILASSGQLDPQMYGPSVPLHLTKFMKGRGRPPQSGPLDGEGRRSIYQALNRNFLPPMMLAFDMPVPFSTFGKRNISNVPAQSLTLMNDPFVVQQATFWANNLLGKDQSFEEQIQNIYITAFARPPSSEEMASAKDFFEEQQKLYNTPNNKLWQDPRIWGDYCHSVFNMKEFVFLR